MADMRATDRLRADHHALRTAAGRLGAALREQPEAWLGALRGSCRELAGQLRRHMRQERRLATGYARGLPRLSAWELDRLSLEHQDEWRQLVILRLYTRSNGPFSVVDVRLMIGAFARRLEEQSAAQEARLFPLLQEAVIAPPGENANNGRNHHE